MDWWYEWPSLTLQWKIEGDENKRLKGAALILMKQVKDRMRLGGLNNLRAVRIFNTGSMIVARSTFGQDFLHIKNIEGVTDAGEETCSIVFINIPEVVQPMRNRGVILPSEVEGVDYVKTYYSFINSCPTCSAPEWETSFSFSDRDADPNPTNQESTEEISHCDISIDSGCFGEILEFGSDLDGTFIKWKAYTDLEESRSGLGYMLLKMLVGHARGDVTCKASSVIKVNCCEKYGLERVVNIYWENCDGRPTGELITFEGVILCKVPLSVDLDKLLSYVADQKLFYVIPILDGACLPILWTVDQNVGTMKVSNLGISARFVPSPFVRELCHGFPITATDSCGSYDLFNALCCGQPRPPVELHYTSLVMGCGETQELFVTGGCPPYQWENIFACGTFSEPFGTYHDRIFYTSPPVNPNCVCSPRIVVKDCCDEQANVGITVQCYTGVIPAMKVCTLSISGCSTLGDLCVGVVVAHNDLYYCNGTIQSTCDFVSNPINSTCSKFDCPGCSCATQLAWIEENSSSFVTCSGCFFPPYWNGPTYDLREDNGILDDGCCPIDPQTGEPM